MYGDQKKIEGSRMPQGPSIQNLNLASTDSPAKERVPLTEKVEQLGYAMNRIESKVDQIQRILFGLADPQGDSTGRSPQSVDDVMDDIGNKTGSIDYTLDRIIRRLAGDC